MGELLDMTMPATLRMTVLKLDWWLHVACGAALGLAFGLRLHPAWWVPGIVATYMFGDVRETLQQIGSFEVRVLSSKQVRGLGAPYDFDDVAGLEGAPLGAKRRHEALAWLWGALLGVAIGWALR